MTRFQLHVAEWKNCHLCHLHEVRRRVVHYRGAIPCDVLFVGQAPGEAEDVRGVPFDGQAGEQLDRIVKQALPKNSKLRLGYTNLVGCIPRDEKGGKEKEPEAESIVACAPRLTELAELANPRGLVLLGRMAGDWYTEAIDPLYRSGKWKVGAVKCCHLVHPSSILRLPLASQSLSIKRCVVNLSNLFEELK